MSGVGAARHTFVFADLAGFTALTEVHGDDQAADLAVEFCRSVNRLLPPGAEDLKMLGDACLLRVDEASDAVALGLSLTGEVATRHGVPDVRVGMHTGTAVRRGAEWFGAAINIAARVAAMAGPGEVLLTATTRDAVAKRPDVRFADRGVHELRHVSTPVQLYSAHRALSGNGTARWSVDPVCRMRVDAKRAASAVEDRGVEVFFCSTTCAATFARSPERYRGEPAAQA